MGGRGGPWGEGKTMGKVRELGGHGEVGDG